MGRRGPRRLRSRDGHRADQVTQGCQEAVARGDRRAGERNSRDAGRGVCEKRRTSRPQPRGRRADARLAPGAREPPRPDRLGRQPPSVRAEDADRALRSHHDDPHRRRTLRLLDALGVRARRLRSGARLDVDFGRARNGAGARSGRRQRNRRRDHRRRRADGRPSLRSDQQRRSDEDQLHRDPQRQRDVDRPERRRDGQVPGDAALQAVVQFRAREDQGSPGARSLRRYCAQGAVDVAKKRRCASPRANPKPR